MDTGGSAPITSYYGTATHRGAKYPEDLALSHF
jgi:hypothetical protein